MSVVLYNGWYVATPYSDIGPTAGTFTSYQKHNAEKVYYTFIAEGWTVNAISAMLGNMTKESNLNPARVYKVGRFPNQGNNLSDIGNNQAVNHPNEAYGLVQWKGRGDTDPNNNQLVGYAIRHNAEWYDGDIQMERMLWEWQGRKKWHPQKVDGVYWTYEDFAHSTLSTDKLAKVWMVCYEGTYSTLDVRKNASKYWYDYFYGNPDVPTPPEPPQPDDPPLPDPDVPTPTPAEWITGDAFATLALSFDPNVTGINIPYSQMDCIGFVNAVWDKIPVVHNNGYYLTNGTNSLWRTTYTYNTTDPYGWYPSSELSYKNTISNTVQLFGYIPTGSLLFHQIGEAGPPPIPAQYAGDGIGNFVHVGIYCGNNQVMQSGGKDSASVVGGGVHKSVYDPTAWNYCAFVCYVNPAGDLPPEPVPQPFRIVDLLMMWYSNNKKGVKKNVKRSI